jgi:hypothetical protein
VYAYELTQIDNGKRVKTRLSEFTTARNILDVLDVLVHGLCIDTVSVCPSVVNDLLLE